jgi:hypothetical protein
MREWRWLAISPKRGKQGVGPSNHQGRTNQTAYAARTQTYVCEPEVSAILGHKDSYVTWKVYAHFCKKESTAVQDLAASILD